MHGVDNVGTVPAALTAYLAVEARPCCIWICIWICCCRAVDSQTVAWSGAASVCSSPMYAKQAISAAYHRCVPLVPSRPCQG